LASVKVDTEQLKAVDAGIWAESNGINLLGGRFSFAGREFQMEMMRDRSRRQCAMKGAQLGGFTDSFVLKIVHGAIHGRYPLGALFLFPTQDEVSDFSTTRLQHLITQNPGTIGRYVRETNRAGLRKIWNTFMYFRSGRAGQYLDDQTKSSSKVKSISVDVMLCDEVDEMDQEVIDKARSRLQASRVKDEYYLGNPTIPDYGIAAMYDGSDQRVWMTHCEKCNTFSCLEMEFPECVKRDKEGKFYRACVKCGAEVYPGSERSQWVARKPDRSEDFVGRWIGHLSCAFGDLKEIMEEWESPRMIKQNFYNLRLGLPYISAENRLLKEDVYDCCGSDVMPHRHPGPCAMGVDVQGHRKGFLVVIGAKVNDSTLKILKVTRVFELNDLYELGKNFHVSCCVVDIQPETRLVREFAENAGFEVFLCQYKESQRKYPNFDSKEHLVTINRTEICDATHNLFKDEPKVILPRLTEEIREYAVQMTNTAKVLEEDERGNKSYSYKKIGSEGDDYYHATNYMLLGCQRVSISREEEDHYSPRDAWDDGFRTHGYGKTGYMGM
jgi:hypothetical protein